jgi:hypothetical protein
MKFSFFHLLTNYDNIKVTPMGDRMKIKRLNVRLSDRRYYKLQSYAATTDKTITQLLEDWIDTLPVVKEIK